MTDLANRILAGEPRALARAATIIENRLDGWTGLMREIFPRTGRALVVGITGSPGSGKSTLTGQLIRAFRAEGCSVAVVAVDPSSPFSGGAILGDRVRMQEHHADPGVFIRSMATRGTLGGLAAATLDLVLLLDAAGKDVVLIETVGAGQDEIEVARIADVTAVVVVPGMGDDIQAIKAGILEAASVLVINKADRPGADELERDLQSAQDRPVLRTVATEGRGIVDLIAALRAGQSRRRMAEHWSGRLVEMYRARMASRLDPEVVRAAAEQVASRERDPYSIIEEWLH
jgi:LAO/AO transport system kinase